MTAADLLQLVLLIGVLAPLASFAFLAFFGSRLGAARRALHAAHASAREAEHEAPAAGEPLAGWVATGAIAASLLCAIIALVQWAGLNAEARALASRSAAEQSPIWLVLGATQVRAGINLDSLTIILFVMVTLTATCIHVFSIGYMRREPRFARFFAYLSLFCFSMLGLLVSPDLLLIFVFWELVGVSSYLLIGFWFEKRSASNAAIKAFVVNRVGDFGFMIGLGLCFTYLGTLSLHEIGAVFQAGAQVVASEGSRLAPTISGVSSAQTVQAAALFQHDFLGISLATWLGLGLFCGAIGKSAQFPLQVWLPDAMEGPTPVSALIHAATMVAAGVYLVGRIFVVLTPEAQLVIAWIGCITLTIAALMAIVQTDIKRVLAYSTLSQLGYMIFGLGVGAWVGALFHLLTHAFFKALLFLGAGQVIAGTHHEQDLRKMGGLAGKMPRTAGTFLIAVLAISGAGVPWTVIGLGGFYSKEEILAVSLFRVAAPAAASNSPQVGSSHAAVSDSAAEDSQAAAGHSNGRSDRHATSDGHVGAHAPAAPQTPRIPWLLYLLPLAIVYVTPFYMGRCFVLAFLGRPRDAHVQQHARESPLMVTPLLVLAAMTLVSGWFLFRDYVEYAAPRGTLAPLLSGHDAAVHAVAGSLALHSGFAWLIGLGAAWWLYRDGLARAEQLRSLPLVRPLHALLVSKFYFDELYAIVFVGGAKALAFVSRVFDSFVIDKLADGAAYLTERMARFSGVVLDQLGVDGLVNGFAALCAACGAGLRRVQTGMIRNYVTLAAAGLLAATLALWSARLALLVMLAVVITLAWPAASRRPRPVAAAPRDPASLDPLARKAAP